MTPVVPIAQHDHRGLTTAEARARLKQFGPNAVVEEKAHPLKEFFKRFWAPIPWLSGSDDHPPALPRRARGSGGDRRTARVECGF